MHAELWIAGTTYQYTAEAEAGVYLDNGARWWGTRLRYRPAGRGRWRHKVLVDVHPLDFRTVNAALEAIVRGGHDAQ